MRADCGSSRRSTSRRAGYRARRFRQTPGGRELAEIDLFEVSVVTHPLQHAARIHFTA